jgi:hypothetical protein
MKRLLLIGSAACAFAFTPTLSASAMPAAKPGVLGGSDGAVIQVKGGPPQTRDDNQTLTPGLQEGLLADPPTSIFNR